MLGIRRMDKEPNPQVKEVCGVWKGVDEAIDEGVLWWFGHVQKMEIDRIAKMVM